MDSELGKLRADLDLKEAFVTGHGGTTPYEIVLVLLVTPVFLLLHEVQVEHLWDQRGRVTSSACSSARPNLPLTVLREVVFIIVPAILAAIYPIHVLAPIIIIALCFCVLLPIFLSAQDGDLKESDGYSGRTPAHRRRWVGAHAFHRPYYVSCYRASVIVWSFMCILAVDFPAFPRRYAKTEVSGTGLMDLGVTSFTVAAALVSRSAKRSAVTSGVTVEKRDDLHHHLINNNIHNPVTLILRCLRSAVVSTQASLPLLLLGLLRLFLLRSIEYQQHVTEYGVHWNFFFTAAGTSIASTVLDEVLQFCISRPPSPSSPSSPSPSSSDSCKRENTSPDRVGLCWVGIGVLLLLFYEWMLHIMPLPLWLSSVGPERETFKTLKGFILHAERTLITSGPLLENDTSQWLVVVHTLRTFFVQNREGLCGMLGFLAIHCVTVGLVRLIGVWTNNSSSPSHFSSRAYLSTMAKRFATCSVVLWLAFGVTSSYVYPPSRRLVNISYICWSLAQQFTSMTHFIGLSLWIRRWQPVKTLLPHSLLVESFNANMLPVFLVANVMTGLVNISIDTLNTSTFGAVLMLMVYGLIVSSVAVWFYVGPWDWRSRSSWLSSRRGWLGGSERRTTDRKQPVEIRQAKKTK